MIKNCVAQEALQRTARTFDDLIYELKQMLEKEEVKDIKDRDQVYDIIGGLKMCLPLIESVLTHKKKSFRTIDKEKEQDSSTSSAVSGKSSSFKKLTKEEEELHNKEESLTKSSSVNLNKDKKEYDPDSVGKGSSLSIAPQKMTPDEEQAAGKNASPTDSSFVDLNKAKPRQVEGRQEETMKRSSGEEETSSNNPLEATLRILEEVKDEVLNRLNEGSVPVKERESAYTMVGTVNFCLPIIKGCDLLITALEKEKNIRQVPSSVEEKVPSEKDKVQENQLNR